MVLKFEFNFRKCRNSDDYSDGNYFGLLSNNSFQNAIISLNHTGNRDIEIDKLIIRFRYNFVISFSKKQQITTHYESRCGENIFIKHCIVLKAQESTHLICNVDPVSFTKYNHYPAGIKVMLQNGNSYEAEPTFPKAYYNKFKPPVNIALQESKTFVFIPYPKIYNVDKSNLVKPPSSIKLVGWSEGHKLWLSRILKRFKSEILIDDRSSYIVSHKTTHNSKEFYNLKLDNKGIRASSSVNYCTNPLSTIAMLLIQWHEKKACYGFFIEDEAKYRYRGLMLDCARNFTPYEDLQGWCDIAILYKLSYLHLHLTDDEGWRIEIPEIPQITKFNSSGWINNQQQSKNCNKQFYTVEYINEVTEQIKGLGLKIIPEINLPAHARTLKQSVPSLQERCDSSNYNSVQFYSDNVIQPFYASTLETVLIIINSVIKTFDASVIHIGNDEVPENVWQHSFSANCFYHSKTSKSNSKNTIKNEINLRFLQYVSRFLKNKGVKLAAWDDVLKLSDYPDNSIIYLWQKMTKSINYKPSCSFVLCPAEYTYFDHCQNKDLNSPGVNWACDAISLEKVYNWQVKFPKNISSKQLYGIQAHLWSELIDSKLKAEYMMFPRLLALTEVAWGTSCKNNYDKDISLEENQTSDITRSDNSQFVVADRISFKSRSDFMVYLLSKANITGFSN